ncbi:DUF6011 domain-containing protein [Streptomyces sp. SID13666]|uniref:DUF6011 domain-containing protein n=1 Tax=Streptomyces sp. SID13666 TaxID=2706054 RepID=UPI0034E06205
MPEPPSPAARQTSSPSPPCQPAGGGPSSSCRECGRPLTDELSTAWSGMGQRAPAICSSECVARPLPAGTH